VVRLLDLIPPTRSTLHKGSAHNGGASNNPIPCPRVYKVYMRRCKDKKKVEQQETGEWEENMKFEIKAKRRKKVMETVKSMENANL
jgi:hypothetical protein